MSTKEEMLFEYLNKNHRGKDMKVHSKELEERFGIGSSTVRRYINKLRKSGVPVCSDSKGYWIAISPEEINGTVKRLGAFTREVDNARTGLAFATIQMRSVTRVREESIEITVKVK